MEEYLREPCPWRIASDSGSAFTLGAVGGSIFQTVKGFRNSPSGLTNRSNGSLTAIRTRAPVIGGSFAMWGFVFAATECSIAYVRKKEDPWNFIASGAVAGGLLSIRNGAAAMTGSVILSGVLMALFEGVCLMATRFMTPSITVDYEQNQGPDMSHGQ